MLQRGLWDKVGVVNDNIAPAVVGIEYSVVGG